jgi:predicted amidophosphoribosyltransferase
MTTSADTSLRASPLLIDELTRGEHPRLNPNDVCLYFGEKTSGPGVKFDHSVANQLVFNFKKPMERAGQADWKWKLAAIRQSAAMFARAFGPRFSEITFVPAPASKPPGHPMHDPRLMQMLSQMRNASGETAHIREAIRQPSERQPAHAGGPRLTVTQLRALYEFDEDQCRDMRRTIFVVDDVLTNGTTFRVMSDMLKARFPSSGVVGAFIARNVHPPVDFDALFAD